MKRAHTPSPRQRVNLTIPASLLEDARKFGLNLSGAAEVGIAAALKKEKEEAWLRENAKAIAAYHAWYEERGPLLKPIWMQDNGAF